MKDDMGNGYVSQIARAILYVHVSVSMGTRLNKYLNILQHTCCLFSVAMCM